MSLINNCRLGEWNVGNVWYNFHARRTPRTIIIFAFGHFASTAACKPIRRFTIRMQFSYILLTHSRYNNCHPSYLILIIFMQRQFVFLLLTGRNDMAAEISDWSPKIKKKIVRLMRFCRDAASPRSHENYETSTKNSPDIDLAQRRSLSQRFKP